MSSTDIAEVTSTISMTNLSSQEIWKYLEDLNEKEAQKFLPPMIFMGILGVCGFFGNTLVLIVYTKYFRNDASKVFIMSVAIFDLVSNVLCIPCEIIDLNYRFRFQSAGLCKFFRFNTPFTCSGAILTLVVICIERYRKICRYVKPNIQTRTAYKIMACVVVISLVISLPAIVVFGVRTKQIEFNEQTIDTYRCSTSDDYIDTVYPSLFKFGQFLFFLISASMLVVAYSRIGYFVYRHNKHLKSRLGYVETPCTQEIELTNSSSKNTDHDVEEMPSTTHANNTTTPKLHEGRKGSSCSISRITNDISVRFHPERGSASPETITTSGSEDTDHDVVEEVRTNTHVQTTTPKLHISIKGESSSISRIANTIRAKFHSKKQSETNVNIANNGPRRKPRSFLVKNKTTLMLFTITVAFIISYLPHLSISIIKIVSKEVVSSLSYTGFMTYLIFQRSYWLNTAINPVIYCLWNKRFRDGVVAVFFRKTLSDGYRSDTRSG